MKKIIITIISCLFFFNIAYAGTSNTDIEKIELDIDGVYSMHDGLILIEKNAKWGCIDREGNIVIDLIYDELYGFSEGLCGYYDKDTNSYGYIDYQGDRIIQNLPYQPGYFQSGMATIAKEENGHLLWGFINKKGDIIAEPKYLLVGNFSEGLASVSIDSVHYGYINKRGEIIIPSIYIGSGYDFEDGFAHVNTENNEHGYVDKKGDFYTEDEVKKIYKENGLIFTKYKFNYGYYNNLTYNGTWDRESLKNVGITFEKDSNEKYYLLKDKNFKTKINVSLNNKIQEFDVNPITVNDRTMVPFRSIFEKLGMKVDYNTENQEIIAYNDQVQIKIKSGDKNIIVDDNSLQMDVAPFIQDGRLLIPVRFIAEGMGLEVLWNPYTQTVNINTDIYISNPLPGIDYESLIPSDTTTYIDNSFIDIIKNNCTFDSIKPCGNLLSKDEVSALLGDLNVDISDSSDSKYWLVDADNDGEDEIVTYVYSGGSAGFVSLSVYKKNIEGKFETTYNNMIFGFLSKNTFTRYNNKNYFIVESMGYNKKVPIGLDIYSFNNGKIVEWANINNGIVKYKLTESKIFNTKYNEIIKDYTISENDVSGDYNNYKNVVLVLPDETWLTAQEIDKANDTLFGVSRYENWFKSDLNNDGTEEKYYKQVVYPSTLSNVKHLEFGVFSNNKILDLKEFCCMDIMSDNKIPQMIWIENHNNENITFIVSESPNNINSFYVDSFVIKGNKYEKIASQVYESELKVIVNVYTQGINIDFSKIPVY